MNMPRAASRLAIAQLLTAAAPLAILMAAAPAFAQEQDEKVEELVITGSRIRGIEVAGSNVAAISREEIEEASAATTGDLLRKFPQVIGIGPSATGATAQNAAANVTRSVGLNLRGIGVNATLPLWEGRRFPAAGTQGQLVDISVIPTIALERVEVVPDGSSAIYGSDAITGVVNLLLRKNIDGGEVRARYGSADGYNESQVGLVVGKRWEGGSFMFAAEHAANSPLSGRDRDWYTQNLTPRGGRDYRTTACNPGTITVSGQTYAIPAGGVTSASQLTAGTVNRCDNIKGNWIIPKQERESFTASVEQEVLEGVEVFALGYYSNRNLILLGNGGTPGATLAAQSVPRTNPFFVSPNPTAASVTVAISLFPVVGVDYNPGFARSRDAVIGVRADLWGDWKGEVAVSDGGSQDEIRRTQNINAAAVTAALADTNPATSLNLFGGPNNAATLSSIRNGLFIIGAETGLSGVEARADGSLFELPAGTVRMAVGAEYRQEDLYTSLINGAPSAPVTVVNTVERDVRAIYAEVNAPLAEGLNLSVAGRFEQYAAFGETFNPKVGLTWSVNDQFKLRATYGESFRAPSPVEYDTIGGGAGLYGDTTVINGVSRFGIGIAGGNIGLEPEEATTWSAGFDYKPSWAEGLTLSATLFDLDYTNQIVGLRGTPGLFTNPVYARFVNFAPTTAEITALLASGLPINTPINAAAVTYIADGRRQNLGSTEAQGIDFEIDYVLPTEMGDFDVGIAGALFTNFDTSIAQGAPVIDTLGLINNPQELRFRAHGGWRKDAFRAVAFVNYVDGYTNTTVTPNQAIDSYMTLDLQMSYDFGVGGDGPLRDGVRLALDIQNALDEEPPFVDAATGGYDPQNASPIGRVIAVSLSKRW